MNQVHVQEIECLLVLADELHFGRTATRLGCSQSRVSQLVASLERRVGVRLVDRTSRRVSLSPFGAQFVDEVRPAYETLSTVITRARERAGSGTLQRLRVGFHGSVYEEVTEAFRRLRAHHDVTMALSEIPLGSPFSAVLDGQVDAVVVELPATDPALTCGFRFLRRTGCSPSRPPTRWPRPGGRMSRSWPVWISSIRPGKPPTTGRPPGCRVPPRGRARPFHHGDHHRPGGPRARRLRRARHAGLPPAGRARRPR